MSESAWDEVQAAIETAPYPVEVLAADPARAEQCLARLGITTRSWLGAVTTFTGGILVDHGWLRVLGCGTDTMRDVVAETEAAGGLLIVGHDVLGGQFAWASRDPAMPPTVHYFGPDDLTWLDLDQGYADWLYAVLAGSMTRFYETLRWPGWQAEVGAVKPGQGIHAWPPPWTVEGKDLGTVSRRVIPIAELVAFHHDTAQQLS